VVVQAALDAAGQGRDEPGGLADSVEGPADGGERQSGEPAPIGVARAALALTERPR
jgi:hypothetical protein